MDQNLPNGDRKRSPNLFLVLLLAIGLPILGVSVMQTVRRVIPLWAEAGANSTPAEAESPATPTPTPSPTPKPTPVVSPLAPQPAPSAPAEAAALGSLVSGTIAAGETSSAPAAESETRLVQQEVLKRIDLMPDLSPAEQDKLYLQVERARSMQCIARLAFAPGASAPTSTQVQELTTILKGPANKAMLEDPTTVLVVLGFADKKGDDATNFRVSLARADRVREAIRDRCGVQNVIHSVGMGSSDLFDANNLDKNRLVEVWIVLP